MLGHGLNLWLPNRGGFSPAALFAASEPGAWYDPSDLTTLFQDSAGTTPVTASGQPVGLMLDKSGRGNHATQATAAARPTYNEAGGLRWLAFDGVDDFMITPTITPGTDKVQFFGGVRKLSDAAIGAVCEFSASTDTNNGTFFLLAPRDGATANYGWRSKGTLVVDLRATPYAAPVSNVVTGLSDIAADSATVRVNGVVAATDITTDQGTGNYLAYPLYIGMRSGASLPFNGRIYSLIARFGATLDAAAVASTEAWVAGKTGVTL